MSEQVIITRRSKVGFGYTANAENDERGNLVVSAVRKPDYTGTILTVEKEISQDRTLASFKSGTYHRTAWFVKVYGTWRQIKNDDHNMYELGKLTDIYTNMHGEKGYYADAVTVEIE